MFKKFIEDERGISEEVFKLAMIVIVVAAVLAILASILKSVDDSSKKITTTTSDVTEEEARKFCENQGGNYDSTTGDCDF